MKIRLGFVSNSSSQSFTVFRNKISKQQEWMLMHYQDVAKYLLEQEDFDERVEDDDRLGLEYASDGYNLSITDSTIEGETTMANFDFVSYLLNVVGVSRDAITYWNSNG